MYTTGFFNHKKKLWLIQAKDFVRDFFQVHLHLSTLILSIIEIVTVPFLKLPPLQL